MCKRDDETHEQYTQRIQMAVEAMLAEKDKLMQGFQDSDANDEYIGALAVKLNAFIVDYMHRAGGFDPDMHEVETIFEAAAAVQLAKFVRRMMGGQ